MTRLFEAAKADADAQKARSDVLEEALEREKQARAKADEAKESAILAREQYASHSLSVQAELDTMKEKVFHQSQTITRITKDLKEQTDVVNRLQSEWKINNTSDEDLRVMVADLTLEINGMNKSKKSLEDMCRDKVEQCERLHQENARLKKQFNTFPSIAPFGAMDEDKENAVIAVRVVLFNCDAYLTVLLPQESGSVFGANRLGNASVSSASSAWFKIFVCDYLVLLTTKAHCRF